MRRWPGLSIARRTLGWAAALALLPGACASRPSAIEQRGQPSSAVSQPANDPLAVGATAATSAAPLPTLSRAALLAHWNALRGDPYPLDAVERFVDDPEEALSCAPEAMVDYPGTHLRFRGAVKIDPAFQERLERFERLAVETAKEVYGREPRRIQHFGAFSCRKSRTRSHRLSEHALGNAVDVSGFQFGPAARDEALPEGVPKHLKGAFQVKVLQHWGAEKPAAATVHARFLRLLTERLSEDDTFRVMIGPARPDHRDHLHFDMSPWRYVYL